MELSIENTKSHQIFTRSPSLMYDWVLNKPFEDFVQDIPREELAIALVVECL